MKIDNKKKSLKKTRFISDKNTIFKKSGLASFHRDIYNEEIRKKNYPKKCDK
jgi:hypothetical protein